MQFETETLRGLLAVVDHVSPGVLESSHFVRLRTATNSIQMALTGDLHAEAQVPLQGGSPQTIYIDRKLLGNVLNGSAGKEVTLDITEQSVVFNSGKCRVEAPQRQVPGGYGLRPKGTTTEVVLHERSLKHLKTFVQYTPKPPADPHLHGVLIAKDGIYATDTFSIVAAREKTGATVGYCLPAELALAASELNVATVKLINGTSLLELPNGLVCRTLNADLERFPEEMVKVNVDKALKTKTAVSIAGVDFCEALTALHKFGSGDSVVVMQVRKGEAKCSLQLQGPTKVEYTLKLAQPSGEFAMSFYLGRVRTWSDYVNLDASGEGEFTFAQNSSEGWMRIAVESGACQHLIITSQVATPVPAAKPTKPAKAAAAPVEEEEGYEEEEEEEEPVKATSVKKKLVAKKGKSK